MKKYLLGYDIGSSSVKASLVSIETGKSVASAFYPDSEAPIKALNPGWAEQEPDDWWTYVRSFHGEKGKRSSTSSGCAAGISPAAYDCLSRYVESGVSVRHPCALV